ncbi:MAG TPA: sugar phosphate nucleotidyltransferase [Candidatus Paceibacterota bacterium]
MRGIILCGGMGTRLRPLTEIVNKHLLPVYNQPMVVYPLLTLKSLSIKDILMVSGGEHIGRFTEFLGDGRKFGINLTYRVQTKAGGIAEALGLAKDFTQNEKIAVILGDNIFETSFLNIPKEIYKNDKAMIFVKEVSNPERFGVLFEKGNKKWIVEKPKNPKSAKAITGLYIYPNDVFDVISTLVPSARGELEISDVNNYFLKENRAEVSNFSGFWSDAGTFDSLLSSANWLKKISNEDLS